MRKLYYAAALVAMVGCAQATMEDVVVESQDVQASNYVSLTIGSGSADATRIAVDTSGDAWTTSWEASDVVVAVGAEASTKLSMTSYGADVSTFSGNLDASITDYCVFYPGTVSAKSGVISVSYATVAEGCAAPYMVGSELLSAGADASEDFSMKHIGAAMDVQVKFSGLPSSATLVGVKLLNTESTPIYNKATIAYNSLADLTTSDMEAGDITVSDVSMSVSDGVVYSVKFNILPFSVAAGESVSVEFEVYSGGQYYTKVGELTNSGASAVSFVRATNNYLQILCDMSDVDPEAITLFEGETLQLPGTSYAAVNNSVAKVSTTGLVTALSAGVVEVLDMSSSSWVTISIKVINVPAVGDYYYMDGNTISYSEYVNCPTYNGDAEIVGVLVEANPIAGVGKIVSITGTTCAWKTSSTWSDAGVAGDRTMAAIYAEDSTFETYPAFKFSDDLNKQYFGEGNYDYSGTDHYWYMPTEAEVVSLASVYYANYDGWSTWFTTVGGTAWVSLPSSGTSSNYFWTCYEVNETNARGRGFDALGSTTQMGAAKTTATRYVRSMLEVDNLVVSEPVTSVIIPDLVESESGIVAQ